MKTNKLNLRRTYVITLINFVLLQFLSAGTASVIAEEYLHLSVADFSLTVSDKSFKLATPVQPLVSAIESLVGPMAVLESESCMFQGLDREFVWDTIILASYPIGPKHSDTLESILIFGGDWSTSRGIKLGDTMKSVVTLYGDHFLWDYDTMIYSMDDPISSPYIAFQISPEDNSVQSILLFQNTQGQ